MPHPSAREHSLRPITGPNGPANLAGKCPLASDYMDDTPAKETPEKEFNKLDLSQLQGFSFGTQWTQDKASPGESRDRSDRPRREGGDRREGTGPERRDRRGFRKPSGGDFRGGSGSAGGPVPHPEGEAPQRREFSGERGPRREFQGGPRREGYGGPRHGGHGYGGREQHEQRGPYESPYFNVAFYPEDSSFSALAKTIRTSCRTIELFEIARTVVGKNDRFVVVLTRKQAGTPTRGGSAEGAAGTAEAKQPIYISVPDGIPFESEAAVVSHVLTSHLGRFFDMAEVEVDPPKGNFQVINKCGVTGELLGPPNYHRYSQIVQQHFNTKISRMPFEVFRNRIETVRDPEAVAQWLEKMKKTTRYTWKLASKAAAPAAPRPEATVATEGDATAEAAAAEIAVQEGSTTPESAPTITFDAFEDARSYLLTQAREKVLRTVESARFHGKLVETMPQGEIRRAVEGALERQRRFPLDTANALRGRLRREHFTIFKKGSKGISYVCAVKRKFRVPGQTFAETISALITFIEGNPMVKASELPSKFLGIEIPATPSAAPVTSATPAPAAAAPAAENVAPVDAQPTAPAETEAATAAPAPAPSEPTLTIDQRAKISRMQGDLRWLVTEGYVTEFIDGRLFAPPPMVEARRKEVESEEHDPENFPEAPAVAPSAAAPAEPAVPAETSEPAPAPEEAPRTSEAQPTAEIPETTVPAPGEPTVSLPAEVVPVAEPVVLAAPENTSTPEDTVGAEQAKKDENAPATPSSGA